MKNRGIKILLKLAALAVTLPQGGLAAASQAKPVVITSVACDNEYGLAMESAILEGNIRQVDALISRSRGSINDVLAIMNFLPGNGNEMCCPTWNAVSIYKRSLSSKTPSPEQVAFTENTYNPVPDPLEDVRLYATRTFNQLYPTPKGDYHYIERRINEGGLFGNGVTMTVKLLGTPLMIAARARNRFMVAELLKRGANPNVFIAVQDYQPDSYYVNKKATTGAWACRRPFLCALFDVYLQMDPATMDKADAIAKMLLDNGATFYKKPDDYGRTAIWDAARLKSPYLLSEMVKRGFDINVEDNVGKTVAEWSALELPTLAPEATLKKQFIKALRGMGVQIPDGPPPSARGGSETREVNEDDFTAAPTPPIPSAPPVPLVLPTVQKPDNSAEIAMLQSRIWKLRMELEDARGNERAAIVQGVGSISASMRTMDIMREISECESRIMQLRK